MAVTQPTTEETPIRDLAGLDAVENQLRSLVDGLDPERVSPIDAAGAVARLLGVAKLIDSAVLLLAARAAKSGVWERQSCPTPGHWLARLAGTSKSRAETVIATSQRLADLDATRAAVREGALSTDQAAAVAEGSAIDSRAETDLLASAGVDSLWALKQGVERVRAAADPDPAATFERIHAARRATHRSNPDGSATLEITHTPDVIAELRAAAAAEADVIFDTAYKAGRREAHAAYLADGYVNLILDGASKKARRSRKPKFIVLAPLAELLGQPTEAGETAQIPGVGPYPMARLRQQLPDAIIDLVVTHGTDPRTVVTHSRYVPRALQTALEVAYPECVEDGCNITWGLENDHTASPTGYADTRTTDFDGLERRCKHEHRDRTLGRGKYRDPEPQHPDRQNE